MIVTRRGVSGSGYCEVECEFCGYTGTWFWRDTQKWHNEFAEKQCPICGKCAQPISGVAVVVKGGE